MQLRPYQQKAVDDTLAGFEKFQRQLGVIPTGGGKTIVFSSLAKRFLPARTLILAHREELVDQAIEKLFKSTGIFAQKEKAEHSASLQSQVVVASVQTMQRRLKKWPQDHFGLVVADEAHHSIADSWQTVLTHFAPAKILGVTATPDRGDKKNLGRYYENISFEVHLFDLIHKGFLSPIHVQSIPLKIDLAGVRQTAGDYNETDISNALNPYMREIARAIRDEAAFRRTLVFLPLIATSKEFTRICNEEGLAAAHIDGYSEDRKEIQDRFRDGEFEVLNNAMLLTEGYDDPGIECVTILRPTRSRSLYSQMVGRGTRIFPRKENLLLLDFLWMHEKHSLIRPAHLIAESDEEAEEMTEETENAAQRGDGQQELDLEDIASEVRIQREKKLQEELAAKTKRKARVMNAIDFALSLHDNAAAEFEPQEKWEFGPLSEGQRGMLEKNGIDSDSVQCKGHAAKIIDLIYQRQSMGLCTPKQFKYLKQFGHPSPATATVEQASAFLDKRFRKPKERELEPVSH